MNVHYVPNYIIVDDNGNLLWSEAVPSKNCISEELKNRLVATYQKFYMCSKAARPVLSNAPMPDTVSKLLIFAPNRAAAELAAARTYEQGGGYFYFWIE